jgi:NADPH:quinone reductase-like Zn-dependent oxidoreductase
LQPIALLPAKSENFEGTSALETRHQPGLREAGGSTHSSFVRADGEQLREITRLVESGAIEPVVDKVYPLEQVREALAYSESGRATGKVIIKVPPPFRLLQPLLDYGDRNNLRQT